MNIKVLMCAPNYFGVFYSINPWMHPEKEQVDTNKALQEWEKLTTIYKKLGVKVETIKQSKDLPDMVYAANFGFVLNNIFIKSNFKFNERKKEATVTKRFFQKKGFNIYELPDDIVFEGQGDLLRIGNKYFFGWGKRSDKKKIFSQNLR